MFDPSTAPDERCLPLSLPAVAKALRASTLAPHTDALIEACEQAILTRRQGNVPLWVAALNRLPQREAVTNLTLDLSADTVTASFTYAADRSPESVAAFKESLKSFMPWRKGPFCIGEMAAYFRCFVAFARSQCTGCWMWQWLPLVAFKSGRS